MIANRFLVSILIVLSSETFAAEVLSFGGVDGGGGKGVLCETGNVKTVESLDLYEAKNVWGYTIPSGGNLETEIRRVMPIYWSAVFESPTEAPFKYDEKSVQYFKDMYQKEFIDLMRFIPLGSRLRPTEDATIILDPPPSCKIVQVLVYLDEGMGSSGIVVDKEYWDLLDDQNRLALSVHERDYKIRRYGGLRTSDAIRKYVGAFFALATFPSPFREVREAKNVLSCETKSTDPEDYNSARFYVVSLEEQSPANVPHTTLYFDSFGKFGARKGPVEYKAQSVTTFNYFMGEPGPGIYGGPLFVNSIVGGENLALIGKEKCQPGETWGCPVDLFLNKRGDDGSAIQEQVFCKKVDVVPN